MIDMFFFSKVIEVMLFVFIISKLKIKKEIKESMCVNEEKKTQANERKLLRSINWMYFVNKTQWIISSN